MANRLKALLQSLRSASDEINLESDALMSAIRSVEQALGKLNIGVQVWLDEPIQTGHDEEAGVSYATQLGYARDDDGKRWHLYLSHTVDGDNDRFVKLTDATRDQKILAVHHVEKLLEVLLGEAKEKADRLSAARKVANDIVADLGPPEEPEGAEEETEEPPF